MRTALTTWFEAAWHVTTAKNGLSAKTLERTLGISYRVTWAMLQRFRVAMMNAKRKQLLGFSSKKYQETSRKLSAFSKKLSG